MLVGADPGTDPLVQCRPMVSEHRSAQDTLLGRGGKAISKMMDLIRKLKVFENESLMHRTAKRPREAF